MKALNEFLNEGKKDHDEIESFLKTIFKKVRIYEYQFGA